MANTERAVTALLEADPSFIQLCDVLYGGAVDTDTVWGDVFAKLDQPSNRERNTKRLGAALGAVSLGIAGKEIFHGGRDLRTALKTPGALKAAGRALKPTGGVKQTLKNAGKNPVLGGTGKVAGGLALAGGDYLGTKELANNSKKPVHKGLVPTGVPTQAKMNAGALTAAKTVTSMAKPQTSTLKPTGGTASTTHGAMGMAKRPTTGAIGYQPMKPASPVSTGTGGMAKRDASFDAEGVFSKFDDDQRVAFGYASVVKHNGSPVVDKQGDYITAEDMEKAAYQYVLSSRVGGDMHKRTADDRPHHTSDLIESTVFTEEKCRAMGLPDEVAKQLDGKWWIGMKIHDDEAWAEVKKGNRKGFSIHGRGKRVDHDLDELMGA